MAANSYVTIDGKQYNVFETRYEPVVEKFQRVHVTTGGTTVSQNFGFTDYRWGFNLRVPYTGDATWGSLADLKTAYGKNYVTFIDHYAVDQGTVYMEGPVVDRPISPLIDGTAVFTIPVDLRKRQT